MGNTYEIEYRTVGADKAAADIDRLGASVAALDKAAAGGKLKLEIQAGGAGRTGQLLDGIVKAIAGLKGSSAQSLTPIVNALDQIQFYSSGATKALAGMVATVSRLGRSKDALAGLASELWAINNAAVAGSGNAAKLTAEMLGLGQTGKGVSDLRDRMQQLQRTTYGATKNTEDLGKALGSISPSGLAGVQASATGAASAIKGIGAATSGLNGAVSKDLIPAGVAMGALTKSSRRLSTSLAKADGRAKGLGGSLTSLAGSIAILNGLRSAVQGAGQALGDARKHVDEQGAKNLAIRDRYRELANLQGKAAPDDSVIASALQLRVAAGLSDTEANDALRKFEGGLPAGRDKGNITGNSTSGVAGDFLRESVRTGTRVGLSAGSASDLATILAQNEKIDSGMGGAAQVQSIVDLLNPGRGDLPKLITSLSKNVGNLVGPNAPFKTVEEFAAAQQVTSLNASEPQSGTRVQQAARELYGFGKSQGPALEAYGVSPDARFAENLEKLAPLVDGDRRPLAEAMARRSGGLVGEKGAIRTPGEYLTILEGLGEKGKPEDAEGTLKTATDNLRSALARPKSKVELERIGVKAGDDLETQMGALMPELERRRADGASDDESLRALGIGSAEGRNALGQVSGLFADPAISDRLKDARQGKLKAPVKNPEVLMALAGFRNSQGRGSIVQLLNNRKRLKDATAQARTKGDPARVKSLNDQFYASDDAQNRVGAARADAANFVQGRKVEALEVARKGAEARLRNAQKLDTPASNFDEYMGDLAITRMLGGLVNAIGGKPTKASDIPIMLGGKPTRQIRVDAEAERVAKAEAARVGVNIHGGQLADRFGPGSMALPEERFGPLAEEVRKKGGNPFAVGGGDPGQPGQSVESLLQTLINETRQGNDQRARQAQPNFLPMVPPAGRIGANGPILGP